MEGLFSKSRSQMSRFGIWEQCMGETERLITKNFEVLRICEQTPGKETLAKFICQTEKHHGARAQSFEYF